MVNVRSEVEITYDSNMRYYMNLPKRNNRFYWTRPDGYPQIRIYHKKGVGKKMPRYLLKCGCCEEKLEIFYDDEGLEVNGVNGSISDWREILLPLLRIKQKGNKLIAMIEEAKKIKGKSVSAKEYFAKRSKSADKTCLDLHSWNM